ncbi:hypothetical protein CO033_03270 [Candidatus Nomurabacteria bacterium CG_4_9_14_0_2_um_filter_32_10]|uniref:Septum formation initiator n=3 Tax=Candidatus Nomuraibacteriota TaxID=1752729 RepID=A0A2H0CFR6_9BACT|nr:MAG: hypothetical protein COW91_03295 [Candidatus Nomurabacteria bacterium CG22_combo_CG10-13_8_21_14_all_32_8]PIZ85328.1 MAG: hypothetical protein COX94_02940 [Candidatus Nomurabacteria bacterium CG_4_10_14_0_2_um_filter_33_9]PJC49116.1 MAG: hypothetical protein CO033_03270 [Candidatus Nomurabacteria bacterium CG_4_9_14_0_2_um_filter_32_10]
MRNFQKGGKLKQIMQSKFFLIFLGIIILVFAFNIFNFINKMVETGKNKNLVEDKIIELEKSKEEFNSEINKLKTEKGIEESLREKFGVAKEGENMIMVVEDKNLPVKEKEENSSGFWSFIKSWFE